MTSRYKKIYKMNIDLFAQNVAYHCKGTHREHPREPHQKSCQCDEGILYLFAESSGPA